MRALNIRCLIYHQISFIYKYIIIYKPCQLLLCLPGLDYWNKHSVIGKYTGNFIQDCRFEIGRVNGSVNLMKYIISHKPIRLFVCAHQ